MKAIMMLSVVLLGTRLRGADAATTFESTVAGTGRVVLRIQAHLQPTHSTCTVFILLILHELAQQSQ